MRISDWSSDVCSSDLRLGPRPATEVRVKTILVASSKGGVGKITIATHLAAQAALSGQRMVLVDADPQLSSTRWAEQRAGLASAVLQMEGSDAARGWQTAPYGRAHVRTPVTNTQIVCD